MYIKIKEVTACNVLITVYIEDNLFYAHYGNHNIFLCHINDVYEWLESNKNTVVTLKEVAQSIISQYMKELPVAPPLLN